MTYDEFEASRDAPCPACGATWVKVRGTRGGREMEHAPGCAYMALYWGVRVAVSSN